MISRKERHRKRMGIKWIVGLFVALFIIGGSIHVAFAGENIETLLTNWFQNKKTESIADIEKAVTNVQDVQTTRLKKELEKAIAEAEEDLNSFTEEQKTSIANELRQYADDLLRDLDVDRLHIAVTRWLCSFFVLL